MTVPPKGAAPLTLIYRGDAVESVHHGVAVLANAKGQVLWHVGDPELVCYMRSSAKLFQALPLVLSGAADAFGFTDPELALACASHRGEDFHVAGTRSMLQKMNLGEDALQCGGHPPNDPDTRHRFLREGTAFDQIHNNCSGKHAAQLAYCLHNHLDIKTYLSKEGANFTEARKMAAVYTGFPEDQMALGIDGCSLPNFTVSMQGMAQSYARLSDPVDIPKDWQAPMARLVGAFAAHSVYTDGTYGFPHLLMQASKGRALLKGGAEGVMCVALLDQGLGLAVKSLDGRDRGYQALITEVLFRLGVIKEAEAKTLTAYFRPKIINRNKLTVGRIAPIVEGLPETL